MAQPGTAIPPAPFPPDPSQLPHAPSQTIHPEVTAGSLPGVNVRPGSDDDGWVTPPPVTLADGTTLQLFKDGEALHAAAEAIAAAQHRICLESYIFAGDPTGEHFSNLLSEQARQGKIVQLIYDDFGSLATSRKLFAQMRKAGVRVRVFHPLRPWECDYSWRPFNRDHRKLLVIDGQRGGLGGLNVGAEYAGSWVVKPSLRPALGLKSTTPCPEHLDYWRDNAIGVVGPSVSMLQTAFDRTWAYLGRVGGGGPIRRCMTLLPAPPSDNPRAFPLPEPNHMSLMATVPTMDSPLRPVLHRLFASARQSINLTIAYFAPDDDLITSLCQAAKRGVRVRLMLPGKCDVPLLVVAARSFYERLMNAGVEIYERQAVVLHAKTMVIDERITVIGSTNLDYRSIEYNLELSAIVASAELGRQMAKLFDNDVIYAKRIDPHHWKRRAWADRLKQFTVSRARYLL